MTVIFRSSQDHRPVLSQWPDPLLTPFSPVISESGLVKQSRNPKEAGSRPPPDVYLRSILCPFFTLIKLCYAKALERSSLVPGPKAKSSSEITDRTPFTMSYQDHYINLVNTAKIKAELYSRTLLVIHFKYSSLYMICPLATISSISKSMSLFLF